MFRKFRRMCAPSSGGMGRRLKKQRKTESRTTLRRVMSSSALMPRKIPPRIMPSMTKAISRFMNGPAKATSISSRRRTPKLLGVTCTGFPQPHSDMVLPPNALNTTSPSGSRMVPTRSMCAMGSMVRRPCIRGVSSPRRTAIQAWANSCKATKAMNARKSISPSIRTCWSILLGGETLGERDGLEHGLGFVHRFVEFTFRRRIVDPTTTGLDVSHAVLDQRGADGDAAIEVAVERKITDAAAVRSALGLFEFGNELHGADLGRAAERAGGEGRAHEIVRRLFRREAAFHLRNDMHHVAVALDGHQILDLHRAVIADAAEIVARKVHEHDVFGAFLGVGEQILLVLQILRGRFASRTRTGDGPDLHFSVFAANMDLRRRADERKAFEFQQEHIRRRVDGTRGAINI